MRYSDVTKLLRAAAESCGREGKDFGTHSLRRGGACQYLQAGASFPDTKLYGRWRSDAAALGYLESAAGSLMKGMERAVCEGKEEVRLLQKRAPPTQRLRQERLKRKIAGLRAQQW